MSNNSPNYFAYKKSKYRKDIAQPPKKPMSKLNFLFQLFIATFIIIFIVMVVSIMKYSSKMDIEYSKKEIKLNSTFAPFQQDNLDNQGYDNEKQLKIDKRLILIQQEENAPSEAKIITPEKSKNEVIGPLLLEENKKIEKEQKIKEATETIFETEEHTKHDVSPILPTDNKNITIMSKVLVGRFSSFEDAQRLQGVIKAKDSSLSPYVKKVGDVFAVQLGSYQDFNIAKNQAKVLKSKGLDVWIYQQ